MRLFISVHKWEKELSRKGAKAQRIPFTRGFEATAITKPHRVFFPLRLCVIAFFVW
jgi:hypothetical protein